MEDVDETTWRFLFGFYPEETALGIAKSQGLTLTTGEEGELRGRLSRARALVKALPASAGQNPGTAEIPSSLLEHLSKLQAEPTFGESTTGMDRWAWKLVDFANLRTFQPSLNWDYVQRLVVKAPDEGDLAGTLKFCLPLAGSGGLQRVAVNFNPSTNTYSLVSDHLDFRLVGQVQGEDAASKRKFFGFLTGFGLPTVTVVRYRDSFLLKNGYHRATALLAKGHKRFPALVVETGSFQMTGAAAPGFFPVDILSSPRPPLLTDFLSEAAVDVRRPKLRTVLTIHAEAQGLAL